MPRKGAFWAPATPTSRSFGSRRHKCATVQQFQDDVDLLDHVAGVLADGKVVGWFQGRMEFGPRALGGSEHSGRSPLAGDAEYDES